MGFFAHTEAHRFRRSRAFDTHCTCTSGSTSSGRRGSSTVECVFYEYSQTRDRRFQKNMAAPECACSRMFLEKPTVPPCLILSATRRPAARLRLRARAYRHRYEHDGRVDDRAGWDGRSRPRRSLGVARRAPRRRVNCARVAFCGRGSWDNEPAEDRSTRADVRLARGRGQAVVTKAVTGPLETRLGSILTSLPQRKTCTSACAAAETCCGKPSSPSPASTPRTCCR